MNDSKFPKAAPMNGNAGGDNDNDIDKTVRLADRHLQEGRLDEARRLCARALDMAPGQVDALNMLGIIAARGGAHQEAAKHFNEALKANASGPVSALLYYNLAASQEALQWFDEAIANYQAALQLNPELTAARQARERVLARAVPFYQQEITKHPNDPRPHSALGIVYRYQDRLEEAVRCSRTALTLKPGYQPAYYNLAYVGNLYRDRGQFDLAAACYREALKHEPKWGEVYHHLAMTYSQECYSDEMRAMETLVDRPDLLDGQRMFLHFALGKSFEDIEDYDKAFEHYAEGCRLKRATYSYDIENEVRYFAAVKEIFSPELFDRHAGTGHRDPSPVFIVGMPRSGTTLVEQILASHPQVHGAGELTELNNVVQIAAQGRAPFPALAARLEAAALQKMGAEYVRRLRMHAPDAALITDKLPGNFLYIGMIRLLLPEAKIIHCRRDPVDTCLSCFKHHFFTYQGRITHRYSYDLAELGRYYRLYEDLMAHWHQVLPGYIHEIEYEALTADPETESRRLVAHCGLPWDDACLMFHSLKRDVRTISSAQVRRPIYRNAVKRWKHYEAHLGPLLDALGTDPTGSA